MPVASASSGQRPLLYSERHHFGSPWRVARRSVPAGITGGLLLSSTERSPTGRCGRSPVVHRNGPFASVSLAFRSFSHRFSMVFLYFLHLFDGSGAFQGLLEHATRGRGDLLHSGERLRSRGALPAVARALPGACAGGLSRPRAALWRLKEVLRGA